MRLQQSRTRSHCYYYTNQTVKCLETHLDSKYATHRVTETVLPLT